MSDNATPAMLSVLQHALGKDEFGRGSASRSHFVTGEYPGNADHQACMACAARGLMIRRPGTELTGGDDLFLVTDAGRSFVAENSPAPPKMTRGAQRYAHFLEADSAMAFGDWLRS